MKAILYGLAAVISVLAFAGAFIGIIWLWFDGCDWVWRKGFPNLAMALTPMAFVLYAMLLMIFIGVYVSVRKP